MDIWWLRGFDNSISFFDKRHIFKPYRDLYRKKDLLSTTDKTKYLELGYRHLGPSQLTEWNDK